MVSDYIPMLNHMKVTKGHTLLVEIFRGDKWEGFFAGWELVSELWQLIEFARAIGYPYYAFAETETLSDESVEFVWG
jgi:hypothetical protein